MISRRVQEIELSATLRISALAAELRAAGQDVLDFSAGQPDFPTPEVVKQAGKEAIDADKTRYTLNQGIAELRAAIAERLRSDLDLDYATDQILVSPGAKASLYFAAMALFDPGDEVLVPSPYWVSYPEQIRLAAATPVFITCSEDRGFKLDPEQVERRITPRTKALLLNYPSNPTGACYSREELKPLAELAVRHRIWIIADEIYSRLLFDGRQFTSIAQIDPEVRSRTVLIDGMSKTYSMTGWRIGYAAGPAEVIAGMARVQSHSTSNAASISQWASVEALKVPGAEIQRRAQEFEQRRNALFGGLREIPGVTCVEPEGSFYAFPNLSGCFNDAVGDGQRMAEYLLREARVAVVPGEAFGAGDHVRLSFAVSLDRVQEGVRRISTALRDLVSA